MNPENDI
jgi:ribosome assembly protein RRB1